MIHPERMTRLSERSVNKEGSYVLYWMQQSQRTVDNHALEYAAKQAADLCLPLVVWFGFTPAFPHANARHYHFMFQGLKDVASVLADRGIPFVVEAADPGRGAAAAGGKAALVVTDGGYLRIQREWRESAATKLICPFIQVESDVIVPVETVSPKEEYAAATIRKKIHRRILEFLSPVKPVSAGVPKPASSGKKNEPGAQAQAERVPSAGRRIDVTRLDDEGIFDLIKTEGVDTSVKPVGWIIGGELEGARRLDTFLAEKLSVYDSLRNDPSRNIQSDLSPYLHFGQLSPLTIVLKLLGHEEKKGRRPFSAAASGEFRPEALSPGAAAFFEELVIRRELSANFCRYNPYYDSLKAQPSWAIESLHAHETDQRPHLYSLKELEEAATHDRYWNAAAVEMYTRGKMHGYMRMYWGKKIIEWSKNAETAHETMVYLNNKYFLDGRDMNGYTGIAWCFGKHDRPWQERAIFGKIRYMNDRGLERKFDMQKYVSEHKA